MERPPTDGRVTSLGQMPAEPSYAGPVTIRRFVPPAPPPPPQGGSSTSTMGAPEETLPPDGGVAVDVEDLVERVADALERRVIDELERRGLRHVPGVW